MRSGLDDNVIETNPSNTPETKQPQRRIFLEQAALAASAMAGVSLIIPMKAANAQDIDGTKMSKKAQGGGLAQRIRVGVRFKMDELQRDLMQERWDLLQPYPNQLRSYVLIFTTYTDAAFPSNSESDSDLRVALRYEVGRFYASVARLQKAITKQALNEAYMAYADMSLHFDEYLHVGGLYTYSDSVVDNEDVYANPNALAYSDPVKDPAEVSNLVVLCRGPNKGKTGIVIGVYPPDEKTNNCVVKLDEYRGFREILVVPRSYAAKRLGEQAPDAVFLIPRK